jgi:hypothetical protein
VRFSFSLISILCLKPVIIKTHDQTTYEWQPHSPPTSLAANPKTLGLSRTHHLAQENTLELYAYPELSYQ